MEVVLVTFGEMEMSQLAVAMRHAFDRVGAHGECVLLEPPGVWSIPGGFSSIGRDHDVGSITPHPERVLDGFIVPAVDHDSFAANPAAVTILAKEHAVSDAGANALDMRRQMEQAGGQ